MNIFQIARYVSVGILTFAVVATVSLLPALFPALPPSLAAAAAIVAAGIVNFSGHRYFTFASRRPLMASLPRYGALVGVNALLSSAIVGLLSGVWALPLLMANAVSLVTVTAIAYLLLQKFVM